MRTNHRGEDVFLYRLRTTPEGARRLFMVYLERINELADHPEWYHLLKNSCTINIGAMRISPAEPDRLISATCSMAGSIATCTTPAGWTRPCRSQSYAGSPGSTRPRLEADQDPDFSARHLRIVTGPIAKSKAPIRQAPGNKQIALSNRSPRGKSPSKDMMSASSAPPKAVSTGATGSRSPSNVPPEFPG